ncbi:MAG: hypothetical protein AMJ78_06550 [Omnitrophica WOR_2 bacterium SM23_29]|nr:MAG: hypothetical protein AMJ78_06550 [Omnitrophica WOR_2 bacterium SM23_29]
MANGLAHKVARSTFWVVASYTFSNILYFLRSVILIRLLNPIDFGLMGIARVVINMLNLFSETGVDRAIVQRKEVNNSVLNTAWIMTAIRGVGLFALLYVFSSLIAHFYNSEHLSPILKFISLSFLINGITSAGIFLFVKELNFKNKVIFEQANAISNTVVSIALAVIFRNVWALVIGYVVGTIVGFVFSYMLHPFRPSLKFELDAAKGLFRFGKYVFGSGVVIFLTIQGPDALVGKILGLNALGFYVLAFSIANTPTTSVTHVVSQIAFPAYAKLQDDLPKLREGYLKVTRLVVFLSAPIAGGIFMLIPEFVKIFLGTRWAPIILPVRILCILGFFRSVATTVGPVFYGIGRPDIEFKLSCLSLMLLGILIYPLSVSMGIVGTSIAFSSVSTIAIFVIMTVIYKLIKLEAERIQFFKVLFFPVAGTALMCFSIFILKIIFSYSLIMAFSMSILMGGGCYILILYVLDRYFGYGLIDTIRFAVNSFRRI